MPMIAKRRKGPGRPSVQIKARTRGATRRLFFVHAVLASVVAFSFGCGSAVGVDPAWEVELPFSQVDLVSIVDDAVFCLGSDADLSVGYAPCRVAIFSAVTGVERYHTILDLRALRTSGGDGGKADFVLVEGTTAIVLSQTGRMRAFEATSGRELWAEDDVDTVYGSGGGYVYASGRGSVLSAFDARTGVRSAVDSNLTWRQQISSATRVAATKGRLYVSTGSSVAAVEAPGWQQRWAQPFDSTHSEIQVAGGFVVATSRRGWHVFDAETGTLQWRFEAYETQRPIPPTVLGDFLFTMRGRASNAEIEDGYLRVYDLATGELRTRHAVARLPEADGLVAAGGRLYLPVTEPHYGWIRRPLVESTSGEALSTTVDVRLSALDGSSGRTVWTSEPAVWGSLVRPSISEDGLVAVAGMSPKRNKPVKLMVYRPVYER